MNRLVPHRCCNLSSIIFFSAAAFAQPGGGPTTVAVSPVVSEHLPPSIRLVGTVLPDRATTVAGEVAGIVSEFDVREGQFLRAGEPICELDAEPAELRLAEAQAGLSELQAKLAELKNGTRPEILQRWEATVAENQAMFDKWQYEQRRVSALFESRQSNPKEKHDTEMEFLAAERRLNQSAAELDMARNGARAEEILAAEHAAAALAARVRLLERELKKMVVRAPFDGYVVVKRTEVGAWLESGGPVADMVAIDVVRARADVPESAVVFCERGAPATVEIEALARTVSGAITRVVPQATAAARTFPVEIELPNKDHRLLPGMFVWANVPSGPPGERLMIDKDAVVQDGLSKRIFVVRPGANDTKMAMPLAVTTGLELGGRISVQAAGLAAGDLVVARANERLYGPTPIVAVPLEDSSSPGAPTSRGGAGVPPAQSTGETPVPPKTK